MAKYPALRFLSFVIRALGWLLIGLGCLGILLIAAAFVGVVYGIYLLLILPSSIGLLFAGVLTLAFGELIRVFIDIALNTERAALTL